MADATKRKLTVTFQKQLATWQNDKGEDTAIYEVQAVNEQGGVVEQKLRTFQEDLPQGELIEFDIEPYDHEKYGRSYTLKMPSQGRASKKDISEMRKQITDLGGRVSALESELAAMKPRSEIERSADEKFGGDDDIPF